VRGERILYAIQYFLPVGTNLFRMETQHRITIVGILGTDIEDRLARSDIDGRQEYSLTSSLTGSLNNSITILGKLFAIQVAMGIYVIES
jgi:hypothetical protein